MSPRASDKRRRLTGRCGERLRRGCGIALCTGLGLLLAASLVHAEYYTVTVTRIEQDLYKVEYQSPSIYIVTRYCYEYVYHEEAVLKYEQYSYDNTLFFDSGGSCEVDEVLVGGR